MSKRTQGIVLMVVGVMVVVLSLAADALGIGADPGIGWKQAVGALVGVIVVGVGAWYWPGFPSSRMMAPAGAPAPMPAMPAASPSPRKSGGSAAPRGSTAPRKQKAAKGPARTARKGSGRGSGRRGRR